MRRRIELVMVVAFGIAGCGGAPAKAPPPPSAAPSGVREAAPEEVPDEVATVVTTSGDELVTFLERATSPEPLPVGAREGLRGVGPAAGRVAETQIAMKRWRCFARRTARDARAAALRVSNEGFLVVPLTWIEAVLQLHGVKAEDARPWYAAMSRRLATTGRARGLARYGNGNASAIDLELRAVGKTDAELVAVARFMKAGEYDPRAYPSIIDGVDGVTTKTMNDHDGVSVLDLLRALPAIASPGASQF